MTTPPSTERAREAIEAVLSNFRPPMTEGDVYKALKLAESTISSLTLRLEEVERERDNLRHNHYPHMCRDGHSQIGHSDQKPDEMCPVCRERNRAENAEERAEAAESRIRALEEVERAARALKFGAYPAHGQGFVLIVTEGNTDDLAKALASLTPSPAETEGKE